MIFNFRNISIKNKMMVIVMLITTISLLFACVVFMIYEVTDFKKKIAVQLQTVAEIIGANTTAAITFMDVDAAAESLNSLKANKNIISAGIYLQDGQLFATYKNDKIKEDVIFSSAPAEGIFFNKEYLEVVRKIKLNNETIGSIYIKSDLTELYSDIKNFLLVAVFILLSSLLIAFIISTRLQQIISKPILKLAEIANEVSIKKDYSVRMSAKGKDEIGNLFHGFNSMLSQIEKQNEELLSAKKIAEKSVKTKESFLANMSHEIRTPMNAIIGFADLISSTDLTTEQKEYIGAIKTSGKNLLVIINDILDFSKVQSGKLVFEQIEFRLSQVISTATELMLPKSIEKNIRLSTKIDKKIPDNLIGDPTRLNQILLNLLGNAVKFTEHGEVKITVDLFSDTNDDVEIKFSVIDTGIGIPENQLSSIFEEFTQASNETTRKYGGTGLGLTIVKQLVESQGGKIVVESKEWTGSTFTFYLKFKKNLLPDDGRKIIGLKDSKEQIVKELNILLVEDNIQNQVLAKKVLTKWNWKVEIADNGTLAVQKLKQNDFDIILMDIQMPEMDGYEATHYIRKRMKPPKCNTPIMAMTAHAMVSEEEKILKAGMNGYISKPFDPNVLYSRIISILNSTQHLSDTSQSTPFPSPPISRVERKELKVLPPMSAKRAMEQGANGGDDSRLPDGQVGGAKHTDLTYLKEISEGSNQFIAEMISMFIEQTPEVLYTMEKHLHNKDWKSLQRVAHKMKPSVSFVGLKEIEKMVAEVENSSKNETELDSLPEKISKIILVCREAIEELRSEIKKFG